MDKSTGNQNTLSSWYYFLILAGSHLQSINVCSTCKKTTIVDTGEHQDETDDV